MWIFLIHIKKKIHQCLYVKPFRLGVIPEYAANEQLLHSTFELTWSSVWQGNKQALFQNVKLFLQALEQFLYMLLCLYITLLLNN